MNDSTKVYVNDDSLKSLEKYLREWAKEEQEKNPDYQLYKKLIDQRKRIRT